TAVIDTHFDCLAVRQIMYSHDGAKRERSVRCGELLHIVGFTAGSRPPVEGMSIPAGHAGFELHRGRRRFMARTGGNEGVESRNPGEAPPANPRLRHNPPLVVRDAVAHSRTKF